MYIGALSKVETAMCLYNGVKLPELPEWDRETYPYALIFYFDASVYVSGTTIAKLYLFDKEAHYAGLMKFSGVNTVVRYDLVSDIKLAEYAGAANIAETITQANVWTYNKTETYAEDDSFNTPTTSYIIWSNYYVVKSSDGSIISTASDPVPLCSYNGVELPELPEGYEYATLNQHDLDRLVSGGKTAVLYFSNQPITKTGTLFTDSKLVISGGYKEYLLVNDLKLVDILGGLYASISEVNKWTLVETGESTTFMIAGDDYDWSNHDILDDDDDVYLPRSEPQPVSIFSESEVARKVSSVYIGVDGVARKVKKAYIGVDGKARLCWEAGGSSEGGTDSTTGVRAYLYNGVKLPELPEWDRAAYPYAVIDEAVLSGVYRLHLFEHLPYAKMAESVGCYYGPMDGSTYVYKGIVSETDHYWDFNAAYPDDDGIYTKNVVWCNFELLNEDGTTYLEASDPVPLCSYNGVELPEFSTKLYNDDYQYRTVHKYVNPSNETFYHYIASANPRTYKEPLDFPVDVYTQAVYTTCYFDGVRFSEIKSYDEVDSLISVGVRDDNVTLIWSSHNIADEINGGIYFETFDPVPVYI